MTIIRGFSITVSAFMLVTLATCLLVAQVGPTFADDQGGFGKKSAGTYLAVQENEAQILQINKDGNLSFIFSRQFGGGALDEPFSDTLGSWRKTGKRQITSIAVDLTFKSMSGTFVGVAATTYIIRFDKNFQKAKVTCEGEIFSPGMNPFDPEADPIPGSSFNCSNEVLKFQRLPR